MGVLGTCAKNIVKGDDKNNDAAIFGVCGLGVGCSGGGGQCGLGVGCSGGGGQCGLGVGCSGGGGQCGLGVGCGGR